MVTYSCRIDEVEITLPVYSDTEAQCVYGLVYSPPQ
jgi:hypothetical protein